MIRHHLRPDRSPLCRLLLAAVLWAAAAGCAVYTPEGAPRISEQPLPRQQPTEYRLAPGDLLSIKFWGNPELNEDVPIRPDGAISLAYVGDVQAAGRTPAELDADLTQRYTGELRRPRISVLVREFNSQRIFVGGEVSKPGMLPIKGPETLVQALQEAGGLLATARRQQIVLLRQQPGGTRIARTIDVRPILSGERPQLDVPLQAMDVVFVPRTRINNVDQFVEQYIRQVLPVAPGLGFVFGGTSSHP
jgi:protein involved in polysaccharide export with SLBB domain